MSLKITLTYWLEASVAATKKWLFKRYQMLPRRFGVVLGVLALTFLIETAFSVSPRAATEVIYGGPTSSNEVSYETNAAVDFTAAEALPGIFDGQQFPVLDVNEVVPGPITTENGAVEAGTLLLATPVLSAASPTTYVVLPGDTFYSIAQNQGSTTEALRKLNPKVSEPLIVGDRITVPQKQISSPSGKAVAWSGDLPPGFSYPADGPVGPPHAFHAAGPFYDAFYGRDIPNALGTPIRAAGDGVVAAAAYGYNGGYGNHILIEHQQVGAVTMYAHLMDGGILVVPGQRVREGEVIGYMGSTGHSTGPHVHFEVRRLARSEAAAD